VAHEDVLRQIPGACIETHALREIDTNAHMFFDLEEATLTLFKDE